MTDTPSPRIRTRQARVIDAAPHVVPGTSIEDDLLHVWKLKVAADEAKKAFEKSKEELETRMLREHKNTVSVEGLRERPAIEAQFMTKTTNVISVAGFKKLVTAEQFDQCVSVGMTAAKKFATENALAAITTSSKSTPYLEVKAKSAAKRR
jgi:hypothetical protein